MNFVEQLEKCPIVAILRGITPDEVVEVCDLLLKYGITLLEIPLNSPNACESIAIAAKHAANKQLVGAGTVLTIEDVQNVHKAGGAFLISPNTDVEVIAETKKLGMLSMPGFVTPTEAFTAIEAGADYLKLFPAGVFGVGYIKDIQAVIKKPILAVGGVNAENLSSFMKVCVGVGIGSALYKPKRSLEEMAQEIEAFLSNKNL